MPGTTVRRVQLKLLKPKNPPSDMTPIPAAGATYVVYRQGATVKTQVTIPAFGTGRAFVQGIGAVVAGDALMWSGDLTVMFYVASVDTAEGSLYLQYGEEDFTLQPNDRLIPAYSPPTLYSDAAGTQTLPSNILTLDPSGEFQFYIAATGYDGVGINLGTPHLYQFDRQSGTLDVGVTWVDARGYSNLQSAVDASPLGGSIFIAAGDRRVPPGGLIIGRQLSLRGEPGTRLLSNAVAANEPVIKIVPGGATLQKVELRDLQLANATRPASKLAGNYGLLCNVPTDGSSQQGDAAATRER